MLFFDTNSYLIHNELDSDINALEENAEFYQNEIDHDKTFIKKMEDSNEMEKFAREKYYLKKENEDIYIIEHEDSIKKEEKRWVNFYLKILMKFPQNSGNSKYNTI